MVRLRLNMPERVRGRLCRQALCHIENFARQRIAKDFSFVKQASASVADGNRLLTLTIVGTTRHGGEGTTFVHLLAHSCSERVDIATATIHKNTHTAKFR